ncbi:MAG: guanylate kinase [Rhodothermia bacterium]|nr:MAG: guanylate kinase [Rhodothermia bacterium]
MRFSISATTRERRKNEEEDVHYHFLSQEQFDQEQLAGRLVEYEEVYPGCSYGTLMSEIELSSKEEPVLLDVDVKGAANVKRIYKDLALVIFIRPPSIHVLEERLRNRKTESEEAFRVRLERAEMELTFEDRFDHKIVNDVLDDAVEEAIQLVANFLGRETE